MARDGAAAPRAAARWRARRPPRASPPAGADVVAERGRERHLGAAPAPFGPTATPTSAPLRSSGRPEQQIDANADDVAHAQRGTEARAPPGRAHDAAAQPSPVSGAAPRGAAGRRARGAVAVDGRFGGGGWRRERIEAAAPRDPASGIGDGAAAAGAGGEPKVKKGGGGVDGPPNVNGTGAAAAPAARPSSKGCQS